jgi:chromatin structure-remodeling complex subunit RSC9
MVLALECGIISEVSWSLNRLLRLSASDRFALGLFPTLPDLLCRWPEWFLEHHQDEDSSLFSPSPSYNINRRLALNSLLVLKNAAMGDDGAGVEAKNPRVRALVFKLMQEFQIPNDMTLEFLLSAMDIFRYTVHKWPAAPTMEQIETLVGIVGRSNDRAILVSGWYGLHHLLDTFTTTVLVTPTSEALNAAIRALPIHIDQVLTAAALEYILAHVSHPSLAKAFLHHPGMPQVLRVLAHQLLHDQTKIIENVTTMLGTAPKTIIAQNNAIWMLELSREELDELSTLTEPSRVTKWSVRQIHRFPS